MADDADKLFQDVFLEREAYLSMFQERRRAFDERMLDHVERRQAFERSLSEEISEERARLADVAPIEPTEIANAPMRRAAYTDRMSAVLAKLALLAYVAFEDPERRLVLETALTHANLRLVGVTKVGGTEAFVTEAANFVAVAFRGTTDRRDLKTDFAIGIGAVRVPGHSNEVRVHSGIYDAFEVVEAPLRALLTSTAQDLPIYFTGHSLGGALALVASAAYSGADKLGARIAAVYTFGAPRVGGRGFADIVKAPHYRVVNEGDLVPLVPPSWLLGYRHTGELLLLRKKRVRVVRQRAWLSTACLAVVGFLSWPLLGFLLFERRHAISLYAARLDAIAKRRGAWS